MDLIDFIAREMPDAGELAALCASSIAGGRIRNMMASPFESRVFRKLLAAYAGSPEAPYGMDRVVLYHQVCDLFEALRLLPGNGDLKGYELKTPSWAGRKLIW